MLDLPLVSRSLKASYGFFVLHIFNYLKSKSEMEKDSAYLDLFSVYAITLDHQLLPIYNHCNHALQTACSGEGELSLSFCLTCSSENCYYLCWFCDSG